MIYPNKGDIRRLITLNTPHLGSTIANLLIALYDCCPKRVGLIDLVNSIDDGAVCDLAENSPAIKDLNWNPVKSYAITATGAPDGGPTSPANYVDTFDKLSLVLPTAVVNAYRFREPNDGIVGLVSQTGLLNPTLNTTNFPSLLHSTGLGDDSLAITKSPLVATTVHKLLSQDTLSENGVVIKQFSNGFPSVFSTGDGDPSSVNGQIDDIAIYARQCDLGNNLNPLSKSATIARTSKSSSNDIKITSPNNGDVIAPGSQLNVNIEIDPSLKPEKAIVISNFSSAVDVVFPFEFVLKVPKDASGPMKIAVGILDTNGDFFTSIPVEVIVKPAEEPLDLLVQSYLTFDYPDNSEIIEKISVIGLYDNGIQRNLSGSKTGTTYRSSDTEVVTVDSEGILTPVGPGVAVVTSEYMGLEGQTVISVSQEGVFLPPKEITDQITIRREGFIFNRRTGYFSQKLILNNQSINPIIGPTYVIVEDLPQNVFVVGGKETKNLLPIGRPAIEVPLENFLVRKGETPIILEFLKFGKEPISYNLRVFQVDQP